MNGQLLETATIPQIVRQLNQMIDRQHPAVRRILETVAEDNAIGIEDILTDNQGHRNAKYIAAYRMRQAGMKLTEVADALGYNDHTGAVYAIKQGKKLEGSDS